MALPTKTDFVGLATTGLELVTNDKGKSAQVLEKTGANGAYVASEVFGEIMSPKCDYEITGTISGFTRNLGQVYSSQGDYALRAISIGTTAAGKPTFSAEAEQIEDDADSTVKKYATPGVDLTPEWKAISFGAFTHTESATLALQSSTFTAECNIGTAPINGVPKASDATGGKATVVATFWSLSDTTEPTVTDGTGWGRTSPMTCTGADGDYFTWTATWTKYLTPVTAS